MEYLISPDTDYVIKVAKTKNTEKVSFCVIIDRCDRPKDAKPWEEGRMVLSPHDDEEKAQKEAEEWGKFLGIPKGPYPSNINGTI